jgi:hypothetical protein
MASELRLEAVNLMVAVVGAGNHLCSAGDEDLHRPVAVNAGRRVDKRIEKERRPMRNSTSPGCLRCAEHGRRRTIAAGF